MVRSAQMAVVKPFRAVRYDGNVAGPLDRIVPPPYDVIDDEQREHLLSPTPFNVAPLTLPEAEQDATRLGHEWFADGALVRDDEPSFWALEQQYVGPDGIERTRRGLVGSLGPGAYENPRVAPP